MDFMSRRLVKRNTCHLLIRSLVSGIWTFGCRTSWSLVYVRLKIMHGIEKTMAPSTHVCSLPDFYLGRDLHGKCEESCVDWKRWLKAKGPRSLHSPQSRQPATEARPAAATGVSCWHFLLHGRPPATCSTARHAKKYLCLVPFDRSMLLPPLKPAQSSRSSAWLCSHLFLTTHATSIRIKASRNVNK